MRKQLKFFTLGSIFILMFSMSLISPMAVLALGGINGASITLQDSGGNNISAPATYVETTTVKFTPDDDILADNGIQVQFDGFDLDDVVLVTDASITQANGGTDLIVDSAQIINPTVNPILFIDIATASDNPDGEITITLINNHVLTPASAGTYKITLATWDLGADGDLGGGDDSIKDGGFAAVVIAPTSGAGTNLVDINGTVDPTLTLDLSDITCGLGTLISTAVNTCQYDSTVSTNASSGYTAYIRDDGNLRNVTNDINDVGDGETTAGSEEYGLATSDTDVVDITAQISSGDCTTANGGAGPVDALPLTTSDQSYATEGTSVDGDVVTLCHSASVLGTTPAGAYASVVTITVVGNF